MLTRDVPARPSLARRLLRGTLVVALLASALTGMAAAGVVTSMSQSYPAPPTGAGSLRWPAPEPIPAERPTVAVVLGESGTVATDALAPYEVFARSFFTYTVAGTRAPRTLSGGIHVLPDRTFAEDLPAPDVVVVPAVVDPSGEVEAELRDWVGAQAAAGSQVLGVCAGAEVLARAGLLDGRRATSHWSRIDALERAHPQTDWLRGHRYVQDGPVTTTAGVTSGIAGALHLVQQLAGPQEAARVAEAVSYPGWSASGGAEIPVQDWALSDLPYALNAAFPWLRPTIALALVDGVRESDVAAAAEVYDGASFAARTISIGAGPTVRTRHGLLLAVHPSGPDIPAIDRLVVLGQGELDRSLTAWATGRGLRAERTGEEAGQFEPLLRDLALSAGRATALTTAKYLEYPLDASRLPGPAWPWRPTALLAAALAVGLGVALAAPGRSGRLRRRLGAARPRPAGRAGARPRTTVPRESTSATRKEAATP